MEVLNDFSSSVIKSFYEIDPTSWRHEGLVVCGTHSPRDTEELIEKIRNARENGIPFYGECFGHQLACIEWARNMMGIKDATSEEFGKGTFVVRKRPSMKVGYHDGESWWSNYEVIPEVERDFMKRKPSWFFTAPFHPSYQSSKSKPHPLIKNYLELCKKQDEHKCKSKFCPHKHKEICKKNEHKFQPYSDLLIQNNGVKCTKCESIFVKVPPIL